MRACTETSNSLIFGVASPSDKSANNTKFFYLHSKKGQWIIDEMERGKVKL